MPAGIGGLPVTAPERPADPPPYPAVHDMPPPRPVRMLDDDQQQKLERDLTAARDRQEGRVSPKAKRQKTQQSAGADDNP